MGPFIIDGFPRNKKQFYEWKEKYGKDINVLAMFSLNVTKKEAIRRISKRQKEENRVDDNIETLKNRLDSYEKDTMPIISELKGEINVIEVDVNRDIDVIFQEISNDIDNLLE